MHCREWMPLIELLSMTLFDRSADLKLERDRILVFLFVASFDDRLANWLINLLFLILSSIMRF